MAWSSTELSATVRALLAADKPLVLGNNRLRGLATAPQWRSGADPKWTSGSDGTSAAAPSTWLSDSYSHKACAASSAQTSWGLLIDLGALVTFDAVAILGHNFGSIGGLTVSLQVATLGDYAGAQEIATWSPASSTKRLVNVAMDHTGNARARQYTAQFVRLLVSKGSAFTPQIGELFLSTRRQLKHNPNLPYDPSARRTSGEAHVSASEIETFYVHAEGQRLINAELNPAEATYRDDIFNLWTSDLSNGRHGFLWLDQPATDPQNAPLMVPPRELAFPWRGPVERVWQLVAKEQGAQFVSVET